MPPTRKRRSANEEEVSINVGERRNVRLKVKQASKTSHHIDADQDDDEDDFDPREFEIVHQIKLKQQKQQQKPGKSIKMLQQDANDGDRRDDDKDSDDEATDEVMFSDQDQIDGVSEEADEDEEEGDDESPSSHIAVSSHPGYRYTGEKKQESINNEVGLMAKLAEIALPSSWPWIETLTLSVPVSTIDIPDPQDDLRRESQFYRACHSAVANQAVHLFNVAHLPYQRPADYYCEMVKPDHHMEKVKDSLIREKSRMNAVAQRKKEQESRKYSKAIQVDKIQQKHAEKKAHMEQLKYQRQQAASGGKIGESGADMEHSTVPGVNEAIRAHKDHLHSKPRQSHRRTAKDAKYGYGGKKRHIKDNDRVSAADTSDFRKGRNKQLFKGMEETKPTGRGGRAGGRAGITSSRGGFVNAAGGVGRAGRAGSFRGRGGSRGGSRGGGRGGARGGASGRGRDAPNRPGKARRQQQRGG